MAASRFPGSELPISSGRSANADGASVRIREAITSIRRVRSEPLFIDERIASYSRASSATCSRITRRSLSGARWATRSAISAADWSGCNSRQQRPEGQVQLLNHCGVLIALVDDIARR